MPSVSKLLILLFILLQTACVWNKDSSHPAAQADFVELVTGAGFVHKVWFRSGASDTNDADRVAVLSIYFHGDGKPWLSDTRVARDPTSEHLSSFALWGIDKGPAFFLGRPCYFGLVDAEVCHPGYWTNARYSQGIVVSLQKVVSKLKSRFPNHKLRLVGFSGGGVLATLLANNMKEVTELITVASPLDTEAWARYHGYSPLNASLNPADVVLRANLAHRHFFGEKDKNVSADTAERFLLKNGVEALVIDDADHDCCWAALWRELESQRQQP